MTSVKQDFACAFCSKMYKNPFLLPCDHTLCEEHLNEENVRKNNSITCKTCQKEFEVKDNQMIRPNETMQKLIENENYFSDDEKSLKNQLEQSLRDFLDLHEQFHEVKNSIDSNCGNHFQEIRRKIDVQREELKDQIDKIYIYMVDQLKELEQKYSNSLNAFKVESFDFDKAQTILNETFRDVNLSAESIKKLQSKQDEALSSIKSKIDQLNHFEKFVIKTNEFRANLSFDTDSFGLLVLSDSPRFSFDSKILKRYQVIDLIKLCKFNAGDKWTLLYRGTRDGFGAHNFHSKCDYQSPTLTIIKAKESGFIFGGYTEAAWKSFYGYQFDPNAFLFSLTNKEDKPCIMNVIHPTRAIYCSPNSGPIFGDGTYYFTSDDLHIADNANTNENSSSRLGNSYICPEYEFSSIGAEYLLAGSKFFRLNEIEVYIKN